MMVTLLDLTYSRGESTMTTYTIENLKLNIDPIISYSLKSHDEIHVASNEGSVVIIPENDYEVMKETLYLLSDKKSLSALLEGHNNRDKKIKQKSYSMEDVFSDL